MAKNKKRKRGIRKAKPLYERSTPMYFGNGFEITTQDLRDIGAAIKDKRDINKCVKKIVPADLFCAFVDPEQSTRLVLQIARLFLEMHKVNRAKADS